MHMFHKVVLFAISELFLSEKVGYVGGVLKLCLLVNRRPSASIALEMR